MIDPAQATFIRAMRRHEKRALAFGQVFLGAKLNRIRLRLSGEPVESGAELAALAGDIARDLREGARYRRMNGGSRARTDARSAFLHERAAEACARLEEAQLSELAANSPPAMARRAA
jgi:hypothetical protein